MVSLTKSLLFRKEIKPTDHLAFLILDKNLGRICFIDQGIPQFIREFPVSSYSHLEEASDSVEALNLKIVNEVGSSFDFYARQFNGERIEQMLISSEFAEQDLLSLLEAELKVKLRKFSPVLTTGVAAQVNDMDAIYAMGACVAPPTEALAAFNFLGDKKPKNQFENDLLKSLQPYKEIILLFFICVVCLVGIYVFFQMQLKVAQKQYDQLSLQEGAFLNQPTESIRAELQQDTGMLAQYKGIRAKSDMAFILLRIASHLPQGSMLSDLHMNYEQGDANNIHMTIDMTGNVFKDDPNEEIAVVNQIFSDFKNDKELAMFIKSVDLVSLNRQVNNGRQVTVFNIQCS